MAVLLVVGACSDDDDAADTTAVPVTTEAAVDPTLAPTTSGAVETTPAATEPTAPPTTSVEDLKAQIAADIQAALLANYAALEDPSLEGLPGHLAAVAVPGSPTEASLTEFVRQLVELGDGIIPGDPDVLEVTVEQVVLGGEAPYTAATATVCIVDNRPQATLAKNTPDSRVIVVEGSDEIQAFREVMEVRSTQAGWLLYDVSQEGNQLFRGVDECPVL